MKMLPFGRLVVLGLIAAIIMPSGTFAKQAPGAAAVPVISPEVSADRRITFRLRAPVALAVRVAAGGASGGCGRGAAPLAGQPAPPGE